MRSIAIIVSLLAIPSVLACSSSSSSSGGGGDGGSGNDGASSSATFTQVYTQVISQKCAPCHTTSGGDGVKFGMLDMTSQSAAYKNLVGVAAAGDQCGGKGTRVVAGNPGSSIMYEKVDPSAASPCGAKMPLGGAALSTAEAALIDSWIAGGASNN
jgi:hypothetical protein